MPRATGHSGRSGSTPSHGDFDAGQRHSSCFSFLCPLDMRLCRRVIVAQTTIAYLENRYLALEEEIEHALQVRPTDDLAIADLRYRKLIVADEIQHNRRLVESFV
jgi:hypothetical protein